MKIQKDYTEKKLFLLKERLQIELVATPFRVLAGLIVTAVYYLIFIR